jgi:hypothetical protein
MTEKGKVIKTTVNLPADAVEAIRSIAESRGITMTEAIRQAIVMEKFLFDAEKAGGKVLIEERDKQVKQIVLR